MGAFVGRDVAIEFAIALEDADPAVLAFKPLGMMRGKSMKTSWDTVDTTRVRKVVNGGTFGLKEVEEMLVKVRRALA
ncbi:MAG: hypothetical protein EON54_11670 [Alcaligenaceae bacterium]|uniref:Uncharacterized protein n=1 Tax=Variovorax guangxiensis TaxID=1775474 RepID=A0A502DY71_9BURK|nr:hypothetical protein [Variovorax guangxiensis]RYH58037.1 MAG: hypothetical protein EON54_11670 [Alcaligenaceae bacterium]TPG26542.1 hypothetical protein EAH83_01865 [Variovorax ginsengisoli]TPG30267.1 hypothetical protein EAH82_01865 [Variovorax guangxiensis]